MARCTQCGRPDAAHTTVSGRVLCDDCHRLLGGLAGAGSALVAGQDLPGAVGTGIACGGWANASAAEVEAIRRRREKLDATTGFWRRLWVRVWG